MGGGSANGGGTSSPTPNAAAAPVQHQQAGSVQEGWLEMKAAVARVGAAATSQKMSNYMLKWQSDDGGDDSKAKEFRAQALESKNILVFVGVVKGDTELKVFHSMVKYNDMSVTNAISGSHIGLMEDTNSSRRPRVFKIP